MSSTWTQKVRDTPKVKPISIEAERARARMPAAVWRELLGARERTLEGDVSVVRVDDGGRIAMVLTGSDWQRLMAYITHLEHALQEEAGSE